MTNARRAGTSWTAWIDRHCRRTKTLLIALPLLLLSVFVDHGLAAAPRPDGSMDRSGQASGFDRSASAEGKAQLPGRPILAITDPQRAKPKLPGDGPAPPMVTEPRAAWVFQSASSRTSHDYLTAQVSALPLAAHPRAPPASA